MELLGLDGLQLEKEASSPLVAYRLKEETVSRMRLKQKYLHETGLHLADWEIFRQLLMRSALAAMPPRWLF